MKKRLRVWSFSIAMTVLFCCFWKTPVFAGSRKLVSEISYGAGELNSAEWNVKDDNIVCKDGKLIIPADASTEETKVISKIVAEKSGFVDELTSVSSIIRLTALPEGEQFILAFGLANIEAYSKEIGNVEMVFTNEGGILFSVIAYGEGGSVAVVDKEKCGVSLNSQFALEAAISSEGILNVEINGAKVCAAEIPVSGKGRFGILQTGGCGAEVSRLIVTCNYYEMPENVNIEEDFENGEFNANVLHSFMNGSNGLFPSYAGIEEYNGNKVFMFRNAGVGYIGTIYEYSNFELSFDIPYMQHTDVYDEDGNLSIRTNNNVCIGFGEQSAMAEGEAYATDTDLILLNGQGAQNWFRKKWIASFRDFFQGSGICDYDRNEGYSVKFTVIDGKGTLQVKALLDSEYVTIAKDEYDDYIKGYVRIWSSGDGNFAIDNLKITNLDENSNLAEVEYVSSVIRADDYVLTEKDTELAFREEPKQNADDQKIDFGMVFIIISMGGAVSLILIGIVIGRVLKQKNLQRRQKNEEQ